MPADGKMVEQLLLTSTNELLFWGYGIAQFLESYTSYAIFTYTSQWCGLPLSAPLGSLVGRSISHSNI